MKFKASVLRWLCGAQLTALMLSPALLDQVLAQSQKPYPVEYYYKVKWGHFEEFLELYKRNHYPILVKLQEMGFIVGMSAVHPRYHSAEASRWDFRYTIVWKDAATAQQGPDTTGIIQRLYPDQEKFRQEEQRRFELLEEHIDLPLVDYDLAAWSSTP